ncbi:cytochrome-c oxidase, cbb3-type subunit III [Methylobrevis albus]|uniref:Cbb3-type cytochrome c oxidase subunit n=1 Tax=Methylobrevis albus TaxID=2793297 RepID=A0A931N022_9HYPH|nr:cytochrome-c oxidase, cbb3-type subunit III [Methylobrevis albus]MBH0238719.1 cytochrome-c oxidase, cbb3-type subunit III [Methylobrevis albus]
MNAHDHKPVDHVTGTETTGHEWDGIRELNTPLPRWWLWSFYASIVFAIGYMVVYPAWPLITGHTAGVIGWSSRGAVASDVAALQAARGDMTAQIDAADLAAIRTDPTLQAFAMAQGRTTFLDNCAGCHGAGGGGAKGYPNLNDDDWLWGGSLEAIETTIRHGIRSADPDTRITDMPAFGRDGLLERADITAVARFVRSLSGQEVPDGTDLAAGAQVFADNCAACHGDDGKGNRDVGAPDLTDAIWLFGSDESSIAAGVTNGRASVMPAWGGRFDDATVKSLVVYVHAFGGGE